MLRIVCFVAPPMIGIMVGKEAGGAGGMIGLGVAVAAGGLAAYAMRKTTELDERRESLPPVVQALLSWGTGFLIFGAPFAAGIMTMFLTKLIVQQMAG